MNLDLTRFSELIRCLSVFKDLCNDVDIRAGFIRQKTNDGAVVFEIDLTPVIGDLNIPISNIKEKLELFKTFLGQNVVIDNDSENYTFSDTYSSIKFKNPDLDFIDNKFITRADLESVISTNNEDMMLSASLISTITDRIRIITQGFHVNNVQVAFSGSEAAITSITQSKDQFANFISGIQSEQEINCGVNLTATPFIIDHDSDILFEMFKNGEDRSLSRLSTTISDINITMYTRAQLLFEEAEDETAPTDTEEGES
jgi:hypothetical protein